MGNAFFNVQSRFLRKTQTKNFHNRNIFIHIIYKSNNKNDDEKYYEFQKYITKNIFEYKQISNFI